MRNDDELKGKGKQTTGTVKDKVGEWSGNRDLETEGEAQKDEGKLQEGFGEGRRKVGEKVREAGDKIAR
ncbi:MAG: CsbD family protein [Gemmatimonadota bacterium]